MIDLNTIKDTIYDWLNGETAVDVIYLDQNMPKINNPYFGLRINSIIRIGHDEIIGPDANGKVKVAGNRDFTLQILGYGSGIIAKTVDAISTLQNPLIKQQLNDGGVIYFDDTPVQDISGLDESEFEERSQVDVMMRTDTLISDVDVGLIEIVNGEATYQQSGKPDFTRNINVDST